MQVRGLFKGLAFPVLTNGALYSVFFGAYGASVRTLCPGDAAPSVGAVFASGCVAGVAQLAVACPVDIVKIKMQLQTGRALKQFLSLYAKN